MKKSISFISFILIALNAFCQEDLLKMLDAETAPKTTPVYATFKSTRAVNLHSNEQMKAKHMDFRIQHRFQPMDLSDSNNYGFYNMFGIDGADIRLALEYGITDKVMVGFGRSYLGKIYDGFIKVKLLEQSKGNKAMPISVNYFGNMAINTMKWSDPNRDNLFSSRLSFVNQLIIAKKINEYVSILVAPTIVHHNLVETKEEPNTILVLGMATSIKLTRSIRFNLEYSPRLNGRNEPTLPNGKAKYYDEFALGFDIETGGHVFQLHLVNAGGLIEQEYLVRNTNKLNFTQLRLGFNISRTFSFK